ncbi:MAG TPA: hypothetical protein VK609_06795, partial [Mucilaginibacter sp.]|nr:hypothetical protein [Mucilaginibacter sp.]
MKRTSPSNKKPNQRSKNRGSKSKFGGIFRLVFRIFKLAFLLFVGLSLLGVLFYRFVRPPFTWLMIERGFQQKARGKEWKIDKQWVSFD